MKLGITLLCALTRAAYGGDSSSSISSSSDSSSIGEKKKYALIMTRGGTDPVKEGYISHSTYYGGILMKEFFEGNDFDKITVCNDFNPEGNGGYGEENEDPNTKPTCENFRKYVKEASEELEKGDVFWFYYEGHGNQIHHKKLVQFSNGTTRYRDVKVGSEEDGKDEYLCLDNRLVDNDIKRCLSTLAKKGVQVIAMVDACHSGTICDLKYEYIPKNEKWRDTNRKYRPRKDEPKKNSRPGINGEGNILCLSATDDASMARGGMFAGSDTYGGYLTLAFLKNISSGSTIKSILDRIYAADDYWVPFWGNVRNLDQYPQFCIDKKVPIETTLSKYLGFQLRNVKSKIEMYGKIKTVGRVSWRGVLWYKINYTVFKRFALQKWYILGSLAWVATRVMTRKWLQYDAKMNGSDCEGYWGSYVHFFWSPVSYLQEVTGYGDASECDYDLTDGNVNLELKVD